MYLPQSYALISYGFLGLCAAAPLLLLRNILPTAVNIWLVMMGIFVPMPLYDYGVIGTIANLKFIFTYLAVLLLIHRHFAPAKSKRIWLVDFLLLLCAYTTVNVYLLLPFALLRYLPDIRQYRRIIRDPSFISLLVLGMLLLCQVYIVKVHGIPVLANGFYQAPYQPQTGIEIFFGRSLLFGYLYQFYTHLNDVTAFVLGAIFIILAAFFAKGRERLIGIFSLYAVLASVLLLLLNRPGISGLFDSYATGATDHYFYVYNLISFVAGAAIISAFAAQLQDTPWRLLVLALPFLLLLQAPKAGSFGSNNFMADTAGTIFQNTASACAQPHGGKVTIVNYPQPPFTISVASSICQQLRQPVTSEPGKLHLAAAGDQFIIKPGIQDMFTQTFTAPRNGLKGINLLFVTFGHPTKDNYWYYLFDSSCRSPLARVHLASERIVDNGYYPITFPTQSASKGKVYCFSLQTSPEKQIQNIALRMTDTGAYPGGKLTLNGQPMQRDVVFELLY